MTGTRVRHALYLLAERALTWCVNPYLRARVLRRLGARIGRNVRVYEARFINLEDGFRNLTIEDDAYVGPGALVDLAGRVSIGTGAVVSPRAVVLTHSDAGEQHGAPLARVYPRRVERVVIGRHAWIGANAVVLCGTEIGEQSVVAANAVVNRDVDPKTVVAGAPARRVRTLDEQ